MDIKLARFLTLYEEVSVVASHLNLDLALVPIDKDNEERGSVIVISDMDKNPDTPNYERFKTETLEEARGFLAGVTSERARIERMR